MKPEQSRIDAMREGLQIRKPLRLEIRNAQTPIRRKPPWLKTRREDLHAVCEEAGCPNVGLEGLRPDFNTKPALLEEVFQASAASNFVNNADSPVRPDGRG
jgi:lipoate synthase